MRQASPSLTSPESQVFVRNFNLGEAFHRSSAGHAGRHEHLDQPYPGGKSWRQAVTRVDRFLGDLPLRWNGQRVLVIGHAATHWGLDHFINGIPLENLVQGDFA